MIGLLQIILLGIIQGAAELLPVSSSAHVIVAEKLLGIDPTSPEATFLLIMLHTGTMFAVLVYFWPAWRERYFSSRERLQKAATDIVIATAVTGVVGLALKFAIEHGLHPGGKKAEVEELFGRLPLIAAGLAVVGIYILVSSRADSQAALPPPSPESSRGAADGSPAVDPGRSDVAPASAFLIGLTQALCLPIRGLSRSGATISTALLCRIGRRRAEEFSFALAIPLTPVLIALETHRLLKARAAGAAGSVLHLTGPGLFGMVCSFLAGLAALRLLSRWLEAGKWRYFGYYCIAAAAAVSILWRAGY